MGSYRYLIVLLFWIYLDDARIGFFLRFVELPRGGRAV